MQATRNCLAALLMLAVLSVYSGTSLAQDAILEYSGVPGARDCHTENCSDWHQLYPPPTCGLSHQESWEDNGDGCLSACDYLTLSGERVHVDWVGPTYWLSCDIILEPMGDPSGPAECQEWVEISPNYGNVWHVDNFGDNGDGVIGECDIVTISGAGIVISCHIFRVGLNIHVTGDGTPTEGRSISELKTLFGIPQF